MLIFVDDVLMMYSFIKCHFDKRQRHQHGAFSMHLDGH